MSINDATPKEWDRAAKSQTPHGDAIAELEDYWLPESSDSFDGYDQPPEDIDPVNSPAHYNTGDIECIKAIKASMSPEAFSGYCKGNSLKYLWRLSYKGKPVEDVRKAIWYANELLVNELEHPKK